jgi:protein-disulfide isomerase
VIAVALPKPPAAITELRPPLTSYQQGLANGTTLGSATAPVVMELYADFQCPACKLFVTTQLKPLLDEFVVPGTLRIQAHDIAFLGAGSRDESLELAAGAACAANQGRYWQFHDYVFWNQGRENRGDHSEAFIRSVAAAAGVEPAAFEACLAGDEVRSGIRSATSGAMAAGISSTPTLIVNGQSMVGVPQYAQLAELIRQQASAAPSGAASTEPSRAPAGNP